MDTNLPTPTTARVYVNLLVGKWWYTLPFGWPWNLAVLKSFPAACILWLAQISCYEIGKSQTLTKRFKFKYFEEPQFCWSKSKCLFQLIFQIFPTSPTSSSDFLDVPTIFPAFSSHIFQLPAPVSVLAPVRDNASAVQRASLPDSSLGVGRLWKTWLWKMAQL